MTGRLSVLRARLIRLGRVRSLLRGVAAGLAWGTALILVGLGVFAVDFWFRLAVGLADLAGSGLPAIADPRHHRVAP